MRINRCITRDGIPKCTLNECLITKLGLKPASC